MKTFIITSGKFFQHNFVHKSSITGPTFITDNFGGHEYKSNVEKFFVGLILAHQSDYFCALHIDHDTYVNQSEVDQYVSKVSFNDEAIHCKINRGCWPVDTTLHYPSGPCILIPSTVRGQIIHAYLTGRRYDIPYADVVLGLIIQDLHIPMVEFPFEFLHYQTPEQLNDNYRNNNSRT